MLRDTLRQIAAESVSFFISFFYLSSFKKPLSSVAPVLCPIIVCEWNKFLFAVCKIWCTEMALSKVKSLPFFKF